MCLTTANRAAERPQITHRTRASQTARDNARWEANRPRAPPADASRQRTVHTVPQRTLHSGRNATPAPFQLLPTSVSFTKRFILETPDEDKVANPGRQTEIYYSYQMTASKRAALSRGHLHDFPHAAGRQQAAQGRHHPRPTGALESGQRRRLRATAIDAGKRHRHACTVTWSEQRTRAWNAPRQRCNDRMRRGHR